ncbi:MAG: hypothetical protein KDC54_01710 [Lewinella sp.]|nr:hypothetical protein [Lewinella sp.]
MRTLLPYLLLMTILTGLPGCKSPAQLIEEGQVVRAYERSLRILRRHRRPGPKHWTWLAHSYTAVQRAEENRLDLLHQATDSTRWFELYAIYDRMLERRRQIDPWLPLPDNLVLAPDYDLGSLERLRDRAREAAGEYCWSQTVQLLLPARNGDKIAARDAHGWLERGLTYLPEQTAHWAPYRQELFDLGTTRIWMTTLPPARGYYDCRSLTEYLVPNNHGPWRRNWLEIHFGAAPRQRIDFIASLEVQRADVSGDQENSSRECITKEVIDGYDVVEEEVRQGDTTIVVKKEVPRKITVSGAIVTVEQYKEACGSIRVYLTTPGPTLPAETWTFHDCEQWSNTYEVCEGDERAHENDCSGSCSSYPSDWSMLDDVADNLRYAAIRQLRRHFGE